MDEVWQWRHGRLSGDAKPVAEVIPERYTQLGAGFGQAEESIATVAARDASDLSLRHLAADVVLRAQSL